MTSSFMRQLSIVYCVVGGIFSIVSGFLFKRIEYSSFGIEEKVNIALIITSLLGVAFSGCLLFAITSILEHTEDTYALLYRLSKEQQGTKPENSRNSKMNLDNVISERVGNTWRCPDCGKSNPVSSRTCKDCGYQK